MHTAKPRCISSFGDILLVPASILIGNYESFIKVSQTAISTIMFGFRTTLGSGLTSLQRYFHGFRKDNSIKSIAVSSLEQMGLFL